MMQSVDAGSQSAPDGKGKEALVQSVDAEAHSFDGDGTANENDRDDCSNIHVSNVSTLH